MRKSTMDPATTVTGNTTKEFPDAECPHCHALVKPWDCETEEGWALYECPVCDFVWTSGEDITK